MSAEAERLLAVCDATWPPASLRREGPWAIRDGGGGGKRVSAAIALDPVTDADIASAEAAMIDMEQAPLFRIGPDDAALDALLEARGHARIDPTAIWVAPVALLTDRPLPRVTALTVWEPLQIMREIWAQGGIGPSRQAVMERAPGPKTGLLGRHRDKPAGAGFVAIHGGVAMVHALEILPHQRRQGVGGWMMRAAAFWAAEHGAGEVAALCTEANAGANALYAGLGMRQAGGYHYRIKPETETARDD
ncbi:MAG: GNAT family N-acetyltransferase [Paracoccaceae bacterium]